MVAVILFGSLFKIEAFHSIQGGTPPTLSLYDVENRASILGTRAVVLSYMQSGPMASPQCFPLNV